MHNVERRCRSRAHLRSSVGFLHMYNSYDCTGSAWPRGATRFSTQIDILFCSVVQIFYCGVCNFRSCGGTASSLQGQSHSLHDAVRDLRHQGGCGRVCCQVSQVISVSRNHRGGCVFASAVCAWKHFLCALCRSGWKKHPSTVVGFNAFQCIFFNGFHKPKQLWMNGRVSIVKFYK